MSVRIHAIAKEIKKTSKEVLEILAERGYELKSASSTIDNITAESLIEEFKSATNLHGAFLSRRKPLFSATCLYE